MRFRHTRHSLQRAGERHISDQEIRDTLDNPEITHTDRDGNPIYIAHPGGRRIKVVVAKGSGNQPKLITVAD